ncbi:Hpt domain-containing protein [Lysobacter sp. LF1]|uniref:histidine kinase n=1 Tax=Lysobacter stagni TaxID=3045172 RepID=A0ABT6XFR9_9GAMM|nr:Hpt domain-containing protein [Lysobacter sp. LF1]MDI9238906.1 Hpt domain-containing protein [Lysobacter sp. LF1]
MTVMREAIDTTTLGWIKPELDETLRLAQQEIEAYAENPADVSRMRHCADQLHQVHGTLRMVELYAPAMVAEEMERLALALQQGKVADRDEACAALMRGVVLLPDYLERLQGGHRDIPIVLLPLLNELRATRGEAGLNESVLFSPDLDRPLPANLPSSAAMRGAASANLAALRDALANWPEEGTPTQTEKLAGAIDGLLGEVVLEPVRRMLWVASSVAGALRDGALPPTRALRQAFGGVEREARLMLSDDGFGAHRGEPAAEPTRQLLYHVAHSDGRHPALDDLRHTFELAAHLPSESELEHARGSLSGRNRALLDTVAAAIKEDLLRVKDALDLHLRTGQTDVAQLKPQVEALGRVSDTLGMMGLGVARTVVLQQRDAMHDITSGKRPADEGALLDVAGALLYVDASLDDQVSRLGLPDDRAEDEMLAGEARKVLDVLVREAIANFGDARQAFVAFVETNWDHAELAEVPRVLDEVSGALRMLELPQPADYLTGVKRYTEVELIGRKRVPNGQQLDTLADALASLEYYLEALREQRPNRNNILDITRQSLETLRYWPLPEFDIAATMAPTSPISREDLAKVPDFELTDEITLDGAVKSAAFDAALPASVAAPVAPAAPAPVAPPAPAPTPVAVATTPQQIAAGGFEHSDDIDDEIREVFLEELDEEIRHLGDLLPVWHEAPEDSERLRPIRRVFHTLKGSGRLVGAKTLGEFSWKIENLLNRVLDGTRPASPAVIGLVGHAYTALPQLHAALRNEGAITADLAAMESHADRLAEGDETHYVPSERKPVEAAAPVVAVVEPIVAADLTLEAVNLDILDAASIDEGFEVEEISFEDVPEPIAFDASSLVEEGMPASVDSVLLEILDAEVSGHLATIEEWLAMPEPRAVDDGLQRAFHTLNGAFAMTEVPVITEITGPTEVYVKRLLASGQPASAEGVAAMTDVADAIRRTLATLKTPAPRIPAFEGLAERMRALRDSLPDARQAMPVDIDAEPAIAYTAIDLSQFTDLAEDIGPDIEDPSHAARVEAELSEARRIEAEREAIEVANAERIDVERVEAERFALEEQQREAERLALLRREEEARAQAERLEAERLEAQRLEAERAQAERLAAERAAAELAQAQRLEADRAQAELAQASERAEAERRAAAEQAAAAQRAEAARLEQQRIEAELLEAERLATERLEAERLEAARLVEEEQEYARLEAQYAEADRAAREQQATIETAPVGHATFAELPSANDLPEVEEVAYAPAAPSVDEQEPAVAALIAQALATAEDPDEALDLSELDPELVDIFVEEASDLLDHSDGLLAQLREAPTERESLVGLQRDLHTIKGGARMAGIMAVGELGHAMESLLEAVVENRCELGRDGVPLLERGFDRLHAMVTRVGERRAIAMPDALIAEFDARSRGETTLKAIASMAAAPVVAKPAVKPAAKPAAEAPAHADVPHAELRPLSAPISDQPAADEDDIGVRAPQEQVRIRADLLDRLVNYAGEVAIYRARLEQQLGAFRGAIAEMAATNTRMRDQLRRLEIETEAQIVARYQREGDDGEQAFDPLELDQFSTLQQLSRALAESAADQTSLQTTLDDLTRQYETLLLQQSRVSSELQEGLMRTRMVPFDGLLPRLRRVVRQASGELGKHVALKLDGTQGELDRNVLERMTAPLEHMLRNAVAHGLETPDKRKKAGKSEEGTIRIAVRREGSEVVLEVGDDGAGLNRDAILNRGRERGLVPDGATLSDAAIDALILEPGFSTAESVSRLAGRGVGMDVVASEVRQLGGTLDIASVPGKGVTFTLRLPQTLAVTQAVFVRIGETTFAVPIASVRGVGRIARDRLDMVDATYRYGGEDYAVHDLGTLVGHGTAKAEGALQMPLLMIRSGDLRAAVCVDQVIGNREIVVKPVGPQVASVPGIFGATIMGDGRVVVILDVAPLVRRQALLPRDHVAVPEVPVETRRVPLVMVVDDSVTMRKVTGRVLERHNFEVLTAKDGIDALERMAERVPDLMLLDIEMPRMDGYELATAMKGDSRLRGVPIVMITSRTGDKHRQRAFEIGVERYLGKPYQEPELIRNVYELLGIEAGATRNE